MPVFSLDPEIQERIVPLVEAMPAFPQSVNRVLQMASDINCSGKALVDVVAKDPVLTLKILRLVNSAYFAVTYKVTSVAQAIVYLGLNTLKNVALSLAMIGVLPQENEAGLDTGAFWMHSLAVGLASRRLAQDLGIPHQDSEEYFVAGLLHDVGKLILARYNPKDYRLALEAAASGADLYPLEQERLGMTHAQVGAFLAERWGLAESLVTCLAWHHEPEKYPQPSMVDTVFAANQMVKRLKLGFSGNAHFTSYTPDFTKRLGLTTEMAASVMSGLNQEVENAKVIIKA